MFFFVTRCAVILNPAPGSAQTFECNGMEGRFINIVNPGIRQYLTVCELEVDGTQIGGDQSPAGNTHLNVKVGRNLS